MSSWDRIWDKEALPFLDELKSLPDQSTHLSINGFNHDANSQISREDFELYLHNLVLDLNIRPIDYLYEFTCESQESKQMHHLFNKVILFESNIVSSEYDIEKRSQDIRKYTQSKTKLNVIGRERIEIGL